MTNSEKARELANQSPVYFMHIYNACLEIAQWKDEQFSKFLLWLDDHYVIRRFTDGESMTYGELIDEFKNMDK